MSFPLDDMQRDALAPAIPSTHSVSALAAGAAWVTLTPPSEADANFMSYELVVGAASGEYEITFADSPSTGDTGMKVPSGTVLRLPRVASPNASMAVGWPSFRATGGSGLTITAMMFRPIP